MTNKEKLNQLRAQVLADLTCDMYDLTHRPTTKQKAGLGAYAGAAMLLGMTTQVLAAPNFFDKLNEMLDNLYIWILGISSGLAVVLIAFRILQYMAASDPQAAKMAKDNIKRVIVAWICINLLGALATVISDLTKGSGWKGHQSNFS